MMKIFLKVHNKNKGFTLVESLVAIAIFTTSILGLMIVLTKSISDTSYAKKKVGAEYLSQEGIEYIRNMRDTYIIPAATAQAGWDAFNTRLANSSCATSTGCYFNDSFSDYNSAVIACTGSCPELLYDSSTGKYGYSGQSSGYVRRIKVVQTTNETKVLSTVFWTQGSGTYSLTLSEVLFNWVD
jgi:prepilin-type N-terminal cleavage/methylation domain-containing protein